MGKWTCKMCGYTHYGEEAPESCPQCGATKSEFYCERKRNWRKCCIPICIVVILLLMISVFCLCSCSTSAKVNNTAVSSLNIDRYMGQWYELARFDHFFERDMTHCTATYLPQDNGIVKVINQGKEDGKWKISEGKVKLTQQPGVMRVSFWGPFYSDYRVLMIAPDYSYALIGGSSDDYLWILSRTRKLSNDTLNSILHEAQRRGYNTEELIWVEQSKM